MASMAGSLATVTSMSNSSIYDVKNLKQFSNADVEFPKEIGSLLSKYDLDEWDMCLVSAPKSFPLEKLKDISDKNSVIKSIEGTVEEEWVCDHLTDDKNTAKNVIIPTNLSDFKFKCVAIKQCVRVTQKMSLSKPNKRNFLPKPPAPVITKGLIERLKPLGCISNKSLPNNDLVKIMKRKDEVEIGEVEIVKSPKKKKKKRKKEKEGWESPDIMSFSTEKIDDESESIPKKKLKKHKHKKDKKAKKDKI